MPYPEPSYSWSRNISQIVFLVLRLIRAFSLMLSSSCCCEYPVLVDVMIKIPHLRWDVLTWGNIQHVHTLTSPSIEAFLCCFMNHFSISCMCPLLLTALPVAHRHLHLLQPLGEGGRDRSAVVLPP